MKIFKKGIAKSLIIMIEDFQKEKKRENKKPTLDLMLKELKSYIKKGL